MTASPGSELRRLRALVGDLDAVVWEADAESSRFTFVSQRALSMLGYSPKLWLDDPSFWADHVHPDDREYVVKEFMAGVTDGRPHDMEYRFIHKDGAVIWLRDIGHAVTDMDGVPQVVRGLMVDVTQQKLAEEVRGQVEARYRALIEHLPAIAYTESVGGEAGIVFVGPQVRQILGVEPEDWFGPTDAWLAQIHPDDRERVREENRIADETLESFHTEYRMIANDGRTVWFRDESILVRDDDGTPAFWQGVMLDITARIHAEEQLREAESRYRALVEQTPVVTYLEAFEPSNVTLYISPQVEGFLGYAPEEFTLPEPVWPGLLYPVDRERVMAANEQAEREETPFNIEYRLVAKDGHVVWVHDQAVLIRDDEGRPLFWQGVWVDITERMRAAELERALEAEREDAAQLRSVDEMKNTFLQAVSHDLRTPLAAILGLAVTLERQDLELNADEAKDLASRIAANARKLDRLVNDLLDLDRLGRGIVEPNREPVDVAALVVQILGASEVLTGREVHVEADPVTAQIDPAKVERIVENLLSNAVRHTPAGTGIWVRVGPQEDGALLVVEDEGPGVALEHRQEIFEPFRQGPGAPEHSPGVGVGLALVARFAELHGGRAWVEDRPGGGASFRVWLPLAPPVG
jgi:PAS domain S-box-containing protein